MRNFRGKTEISGNSLECRNEWPSIRLTVARKIQTKFGSSKENSKFLSAWTWEKNQISLINAEILGNYLEMHEF